MRTKLYAFGFAVASLFLLSGCTKNGTNVISNQQSIEGTWAITGITSNRAYDFDGDGDTETNVYNNYTACGRDIVLLFQSGGYGQVRQGCNAGWQNIAWQFPNNNTLNIFLPDDDLNLQLQQTSNGTIRGVDAVSLNGAYLNITYTLQRR